MVPPAIGGEGWYDDMWCINPEKTAAFIQTVTKPWIAFKVLAAGAYLPRQGFARAFQNSAPLVPPSGAEHVGRRSA